MESLNYIDDFKYTYYDCSLCRDCICGHSKCKHDSSLECTRCDCEEFIPHEQK